MYIVAIHGYPLDGRMWGPLARLSESGALGDDVTFLHPDLRGRGASTREAADVHTTSLLADDVTEDVIERLPAGARFVLAGFSMGGYVLLELLRRHGARLAGRLAAVALCDTRATPDDEAGRAKRRAAADAIRAEGMDAAVRAMLPNLLAPSSLGGEVEALTRRMILETPPAAACGDLAGMAARGDAFDVVAAIAVPLLAVVGEEDRLTPPADAEAMVRAARSSPAARLVRVPGAAHLAPLERPEAVAEGFRELIRSAR